MNMLDWARKEIEIACKRGNPDRAEGEFDYGCCESALKAFESLMGDGHSGFSIGLTRGILNRLIDGQPLTPIEDTDDIWSERLDYHDSYASYQCKRMSSLFKDVYADGKVEYYDVNYCECINIDDPIITYRSSLVSSLIHKMFPITMPYIPDKPMRVMCEDFLTDEKNGDFDTVGIFYALKNKNGEQEKIEINRFFREPYEGEECIYKGWVEISKEEYDERRARKL